MKTREHLSADGLFRLVRQGFAKIKDHRAKNAAIALKDALMSGFAMFSLALHAFGKRLVVVSFR